MSTLKDKFKKSYFIVNKMYLFLIFLILSITNFALGFFYFITSLFIYAWKTLRSKVPIDVDEDLEPETFIYKKTEKRDLKIDLWLPSISSKFNINFPLVFFCHGGGWISGFRNQPNNVSWCRFLASKGFAVASIDYRYGYKNTMDDILSDYKDALDYVKINNESMSIDKERITLMGLSAGGHLALLYATYNSHKENIEAMAGIKSVVTYYAPTDLDDMFESDTKSLFAKFATKQTLKGDSIKDSEIYDYYSPLYWVDKNMVPCLLVHGKMDTTVPISSSLDFAKKLKKLNVEYTLLTHKKGGHSFDTQLKDVTTVNILEKTARYIKKMIM